MSASPPRAGRLLVGVFVTLLVAGVVGAAAIAIGAVVSRDIDGETVGRGILAALSLSCVSFLGLVAAATLRRSASKVFIRMTIVVAIACAATLPVAIWLPRLFDAGLGQFATSVFVVLIAMTLIGQADRQRLEAPGLVLLQRIVLLNAALFTAVLILLIAVEWFDWSIDRGLSLAVLIVWGSITVLGFAVVPLAAARGRARRGAARESIPDRITLALSCPRCGTSQTLPTGLVRCGACRCPLVIEVEEPRCACGYLLYRLEGESCPECGRQIEAAMRWG